MKSTMKLFLMAFTILTITSCVSKKKYFSLQSEMDLRDQEIGKLGVQVNDYMNKFNNCAEAKRNLELELNGLKSNMTIREEQISDLKGQVDDARTQRDKQLNQVGDLTVLSQSANDNIKETLSQLETKDKYINLLQAAKTKADSINLALAVNLKGVLSEGIADQDVEIKVDKTVVFVNLSDKMLFTSGSSEVSPKAYEVLGKIAKIVQSRPDFEVMVEGYTDNVPISNSCMQDNWDLSVKRSTSVVRILQKNFGVNPDRLIAAGRGEYNVLADNSTLDGRSTNRRTRIIILPKLNQFYDLLNPNMASKN